MARRVGRVIGRAGTGAGTLISTPAGVYRLTDVKYYVLFDTVTVANGGQEYKFFLDPSGKTSAETNIQQYGQLQTGWVFETQRIRVLLETDITMADAKILVGVGNSIISYIKDADNEVYTIPTILLSSGAGLFGISNATNAEMITLGLPSLSSVYTLPFATKIIGGKAYYFRLKYGTALAGLSGSRKIQMVLEGVLGREVVGS